MTIFMTGQKRRKLLLVEYFYVYGIQMAAEISLGDQHEDQQVEFDLTLLYQSLCTSLNAVALALPRQTSRGCTRLVGGV